MARPAATLSSDDQRALERAVSNAVSCAQSLNAPLDPTLKTKKKKTKRSQGGTAETGDKTTHKEKRKKQSGVDDASVPRSGESRQGKEEKRDRRRVKLAHQAERGQGTDDELIGSAREQQEQAVMTQQDTQETVTSAPNKKKKKKDKGKQPAIEEAAAISTAADDAPPSFDMAYTSPHSLLSTLFSTAPSLPLPAPDTMDLEQVLLPQGMVPPPGPSPLPYLVNGVPQAMNDTAAQDLNQLLMDLNIAIGTPTIEDPTPSTAALSVPPEELLRIIEALSTLDANKIPGVYKTLNDALAQSAPGQTPASTSGALISIPAPGSLPPGHERAPLPPRSIPRARAQMITTPALVPTPIHQAPRTSESILGNNNVPLSAGIPHAGSGQQTSDAHAHMLAHKWLTSAQLSELVRKEGMRHQPTLMVALTEGSFKHA